MEKRLHALTRQHEDRKNAQRRANRKHRALQAREHEDEPVASPVCNEAARKTDTHREGYAGQKHAGTHAGKKPAHECRRLIARFAAHGLRRVNHRQTESDVNKRKAGEESSQTAHDVVEYRQQPKVLFVVVGRGCGIHGLTRHKINCRDPDATAPTAKAVTTNAPIVNRGLARGQLPRLVRCWGSKQSHTRQRSRTDW